MKITLMDTSKLGSGFARRLSNAGHEVSVTGRDPDKAMTLAAHTATSLPGSPSNRQKATRSAR